MMVWTFDLAAIIFAGDGADEKKNLRRNEMVGER